MAAPPEGGWSLAVSLLHSFPKESARSRAMASVARLSRFPMQRWMKRGRVPGAAGSDGRQLIAHCCPNEPSQFSGFEQRPCASHYSVCAQWFCGRGMSGSLTGCGQWIRLCRTSPQSCLGLLRVGCCRIPGRPGLAASPCSTQPVPAGRQLAAGPCFLHPGSQRHVCHPCGVGMGSLIHLTAQECKW